MDLTQIYAKMKQESEERQASRDNNSKHKLPYKTIFVKPNLSTGATPSLSVRLIPSIGDSRVATRYYTHKLEDGTIIPCEYDIDNKCELCSAINEVKSIKEVHTVEGSKTRTMLYAQLVEVYGYDNNPQYPLPTPGEIFILMGPSSLYNQISDMIVSMGPDGANKLLNDVDGAVINIKRDNNNRVVLFPTYSIFKSANSQQEFETMIAKLPPISKMPTYGWTEDEIRKANAEAAATLRRTYLGVGAVPSNNPDDLVNQAVPVSQMQQSTPVGVMPDPRTIVPTTPQVQVPVTPVVTPTPVQQTVTTPVVNTTPAQSTVTQASAPTSNLQINEQCDKIHDPTKPACLLCLAEPACPFRK